MCTQKHGREQKPHEQGKTQNPVERPVKLRVRSFRRPPKPQVPDDDDRDHTRQHRACHDFAKRELQPQRNAGRQCERRELFKQVVERVEDLTRGQGHPDAYRLNRELGSLCDRDHAVEGARRREHRQGLFQVPCGDRVRAFVDPVALGQRNEPEQRDSDRAVSESAVHFHATLPRNPAAVSVADRSVEVPAWRVFAPGEVPRFARLMGEKIYNGWRDEGPDFTGRKDSPSGYFD